MIKMRKIKQLLGRFLLLALILVFPMLHSTQAEAKENDRLSYIASSDVYANEITDKSVQAIDKEKETDLSGLANLEASQVNASNITRYAGDYGYSTLSSTGKNVYTALEKVAVAFDNSGENARKVTYNGGGTGYITSPVNVSSYNLYIKDMKKIVFAFEADHPMMYWYRGLSYAYTSSGKVTQIYFTVDSSYYKATTRKTIQSRINSGLKSYTNKIDSMKAKDASQFEIEFAMHEMLISKCSYAMNSNNQPETAIWAHNIYGIFYKKSAVCEGYAKAFQLLMNYAGIDSIYAIGRGNGVDHGWNLVKLGGVWYGVDTTWDDTARTYSYFNCSTSLFSKSHKYDSERFPEMYKVPSATSTDTYWYYTYFKLKVANSTYVNSVSGLESLFKQAINKISMRSQYRLRFAVKSEYVNKFKSMVSANYSTIGDSLSINGKRYKLETITWITNNTMSTWIFIDIPVSMISITGIRENATFLDSYQYKATNTNYSSASNITSSIDESVAGGKLTLSYDGKIVGSYKVSKESVSAEKIPSVAYTGKAHTPKVTISIDGKELEEGTDYTLSYSNNVNAGTAQVIVTGKGNYQGKKVVKFTITPLSLQGAHIASVGDRTYTAAAIKPKVKITSAAGATVAASNYTLTYKNNCNIGTATITIIGKNNYKGVLTSTFTITKRKLTACSFASIGKRTYTGKAITPAITVKIGSKKLTKGKDYKVSYSSNVKTGRGKVVVTAMGNNLTGSKTLYFSIVPKKVASISVSSKSRKVTVKWSKSAYVSGYRVAYATSKTGSYKTWGNTTKTSYTKKALKKGKVYYVRVIPYKTIAGKKQYGSASKTVRIVVK